MLALGVGSRRSLLSNINKKRAGGQVVWQGWWRGKKGGRGIYTMFVRFSGLI